MMKGSCGPKRAKLYKEGLLEMLVSCRGLGVGASRTRILEELVLNRSTKRRKRPRALLLRRSTWSGSSRLIKELWTSTRNS